MTLLAMTWMTVWTWVLVGGIAIFVIVAATVAYLGFFDLKALFRDLAERPTDDAG